MTGSSQAPSHKSLVTMEFIDQEDRTYSSRQSIEDLRETLKDFTGARLVIDKQEEGPPTGKPVNIEISGENFEVLGGLALQIKEKIRNVPGLVDIVDDYDRGLPRSSRPGRGQGRPPGAAHLGHRRYGAHGPARRRTAKFRVAEDEYDIRCGTRSLPAEGGGSREPQHLYEGSQIPLSAFATAEFTTGLAAISRIDAQRVVTVSSDVAADYNSAALLKEVQGILEDFSMPPGYTLAYTGENEDMEESTEFIGQTFVLAVMLIFVVLISQFSSITIPLVIISSVLLSLIGVLTGLMVTRTPFGMIMTGVGVISLAGIVVNNAIVLLDYIIQLRARGMEKMEAIMLAGATRFRPVVLTAVTTVLGLIPLTTGFSVNFGGIVHGEFENAVIIGGESSQWWGPMGVAVIWGLVVATFLTLVVVPVMYASIEPTMAFLHRIFIGWWWKHEEEPEYDPEGDDPDGPA